MRTMRNGMFSLFLVAVATPALAGQSVDESRDARPDGTVEITVVRGKIEVEGWAKDKVHVKGELDEYLEAFTFEVDGSRVITNTESKMRNASRLRNSSATAIAGFISGSGIDTKRCQAFAPSMATELHSLQC